MFPCHPLYCTQYASYTHTHAHTTKSLQKNLLYTVCTTQTKWGLWELFVFTPETSYIFPLVTLKAVVLFETISLWFFHWVIILLFVMHCVMVKKEQWSYETMEGKHKVITYRKLGSEQCLLINFQTIPWNYLLLKTTHSINSTGGNKTNSRHVIWSVFHMNADGNRHNHL